MGSLKVGKHYVGVFLGFFFFFLPPIGGCLSGQLAHDCYIPALTHTLTQPSGSGTFSQSSQLTG